MNDAAQNTNQPRTPRRALRWLLIGSLALNVLVIGAVAGAVLSGGKRTSGPPGERSISAPYVSAFERADKRAMRDQMRANLPKRGQTMAENRADYAAFIAELRADDFNSAAAAEIMERQLARTSEILKLGRMLAIERIAQMTPAARAAYADRLEERVAKIGTRKPPKPRD